MTEIPADELAASLRALHAWAERLLGDGARQCADYLATGGPFPGRLDLIALFAKFAGQLYTAISDWARRAEADVAQWPATAGPGLSPHTRARLQTIVDDARRRGLLDNEQQTAASAGHRNTNPPRQRTQQPPGLPPAMTNRDP